ncbi:MAG: tetratricopeptide repeat protein [Myxococcota bacterium]
MATDINSIVCEKCNTMYRYDASKIPAGGRKVRCSTCGHIFLAMPRTAGAAQPSAPREANDEDESELQLEEDDNASKKPSAEPKKEEKKKRILLRQDGTRYAVADTATLQRWIVERRISREAELSMDGEVWDKISERMDLAPFFSIVERNRKSRGKGETQANIPIHPPQATSTPRKREGKESGPKSGTQAGASGREAGPAPSAPTPGPTTSGSLAFANKDTLKELTSTRPASVSSVTQNAAGSAHVGSGTASVSGATPSSREPASSPAPAAPISPAPVPPVAAKTGGASTQPASVPPVPALVVRDPGQASPAREAAPAPVRPPGLPVAAKVLYGLVAALLLATVIYVVLKPGPHTGTGGSEEPAGSPLTEPSPGVPPTETGGNGGVNGTANTGNAGNAETGKPEKVKPADKAAADKAAADKAAADKAAADKAAADKSTGEKPAATPKPAEAKTPVEANASKPAGSAETPQAAPKSSANVTALLKAGNNFLKSEKYGEAVASFRQAAELSPGDARVWNELGWALHHQSQVDYRQQDGLRNQSVDAFKKALELNRRLADAYYGLGVLYQEMGQRAEAARYFRLALDNNLKGRDSINEVRGFLTQLEAQGYTGN